MKPNYLPVEMALLLSLWGISLPAQTPHVASAHSAAKEPDTPQPASQAVRDLLATAQKQFSANVLAEALATMEQALEKARTNKDVAGEALALYASGRLLDRLARQQEAITAFRQSGEAWVRAEDGTEQIKALGEMGRLLLEAKQVEQGKEQWKKAAEIARKEIRRPLAAAQAIDRVGDKAVQAKELLIATECFQQALNLYSQKMPESLDVAISYHKLGVVAYKREDAENAESNIQKALSLYKKGNAPSSRVAEAYTGLGAVAEQSGNFKQAEMYFKQVLDIYDHSSPVPLVLADIFHRLGMVSDALGDFEEAMNYFNKALKVCENSPSSMPLVANIYQSMGVATAKVKDFTQAEKYLRQALDIHKQKDAASQDVGSCYGNLAVILYQRGASAQAEKYVQMAIEIYKEKSPGSLDMASLYNDLGVIAYQHNDFAQAEKYIRQALEIKRVKVPGTLFIVDDYVNLGYVVLQKHPPSALSLLKEAADIIEAQRSKVAVPESRLLLMEKHLNVFPYLLRCYMALHDETEAYNVLERGRARTLTDRLAERNLNLTEAMPSDLLQRQQQITRARQSLLKQRGSIDFALAGENKSEKSAQERTKLAANDAALADVSVQQRQLDADVHQQSPRYASLVYPTPLTLPQVQQTLDPGTLLLEYVLDDEKCYVFAVTQTTLHVYSLPLSGKQLETKVLAFQKMLADPTGSEDYHPLARDLYKALIAPAESEVAQSERLLLCPQGALNTLAFACLLRPRAASATVAPVSSNKTNGKRAASSQAGQETFLAEYHPLHAIVSMNVYAQQQQLRQRKSPNGQYPLLAFGNPIYSRKDWTPEAKTALAQVLARLGGLKLENRPITGNQVQLLKQQVGSGAKVCIGDQATRSQVFKQAEQARIVHFACHGLLDNTDPLASCLALTPENKDDDGLLRAYEVLEKLHLNASLVVLGACQTGLGKPQQQEGIVGLTRSFLYAGSQSVLASLWEIDANSSTVFMQLFYHQLQAGKSKDEALRSAQRQMLRGKTAEGKPLPGWKPEWSNPYHWAAFQLSGDWK